MTRHVSFPVHRRAILWSAMALPVAAAAAKVSWAAADSIESRLAGLEAQHGGRLGVTVLDAASGARSGHRQGELFLLCSTFKFVLAALLLARVDAGEDRLDRALAIPASGLPGNSPVTEHFAGRSMSIAELCRATMTTSDNAAANVLLGHIGGPDAVTAFARSCGDSVTRLDRVEPELNFVSGGGERDTTSPAAMAQLMATVILGETLTPVSAEILVGWLCAARTGMSRLRAGLPSEWLVGDKTGTGSDGPTNDIAIAWPHKRPPIIVTTYYDRTGHTMNQNHAVIAEVGRIVAASFS